MDKEKPEWLKSVERVEAQKKCAPNANIDKKKENKISHQETQDEKPEWLKSVERGIIIGDRPHFPNQTRHHYQYRHTNQIQG